MLLDAAEELFADVGINRTSLRAITSRANANLAAVNYHFGSKDGLVKAVFNRRLGPMNAERLRRLTNLEAEAADGTVGLEAILDAFFRPVFEVDLGSHERLEIVRRLIGRLFSEAEHERDRILESQFGEVGPRFIAALGRALPAVPFEVLLWRFHFAIGAIIQLTLHGTAIDAQSRGLCDPKDAEGLTGHLVAFMAAGFRAPTAAPLTTTPRPPC
jgi:AcrR family transcriptional regulator